MVQDARFIVDISSDGMRASGTFVPAVGEGHPLVLEEVDYELRSNGVTQGIDWEAVKNCIEACNNEHKVLRDVQLARGTASRPAVPEILVFHPKIQNLDPIFLPPEAKGKASAPKPEAGEERKPDSHGTVDFRESSTLFIIHEGQALAVLRPRVEGIPGQTVRGEFVPFETLSATALEPGANVEIRDSRAYATKNGRFAWTAHNFWVEETLELSQDVGYQTGNIRFPGSLILKAGIRDRFKVWVGGNLEASGVIDAYEVFCGGNLQANGGIIGRGKGLVRVRGSMTTRFAEHCDIEVLGSIFIENTSLNTMIYTLDFLKTGDKGKIVGGHVQARAGMEVYQLGNPAGVHTEISVGENYVMHRKLDYARDKYQTISLALQKIQERIKKSPDQSVLEQLARLQEEGQRYQTMMVEILSEINDNEAAELTVTGTIYPGVIVEICRVPLHITKEMKGVRFVLNKENGKVMVDSLSVLKAKDGPKHEAHEARETKEETKPASDA